MQRTANALPEPLVSNPGLIARKPVVTIATSRFLNYLTRRCRRNAIFSPGRFVSVRPGRRVKLNCIEVQV